MNAALPLNPRHPPPLACEALVKRYQGRPVLDALDLALPEGAVLGLIGRNGAGKTTLIRCLLGLSAPDAGEARVFGRPALRLDDAAKARIGYVAQQPELLPWLPVGEMLSFVGRHYPRWDAALVERLLARWALPRERPIAKLSPGERQRLAIIRALAPRPELLVLDEPASALDPSGRRDLLREIVAIAGEDGASVLFSTHILSDLERVASHVAIIDGGRVRLSAELDGLRENCGRLYLPPAAAARTPGPLPGELARRAGQEGALIVLLTREHGATWPAVAGTEGARVEALSLEDLFMELVP
jgi:ABC-2 type transport system ATP-binding protein